MVSTYLNDGFMQQTKIDSTYLENTLSFYWIIQPLFFLSLHAPTIKGHHVKERVQKTYFWVTWVVSPSDLF